MTSIHKKVTKLMRQLSFSNSSEGGNDGGDPGGSSRRHNPLMKSKSGNSIPAKQHSRGSFERKSSKIKGSEAGRTSASTSCFLQNYLTSDQTRQPQPEIKFGKSEHDLPALKLSWMKPEVISACTGPDAGIGIINPSRSHFAPKEPDISFIDYDKDTDTSASETRIGEFSTDQNDNHAPRLSGSSLVASARLGEIARVRDWNSHSEHAFGKAVSLYEVNPVTSTKAGDPIADTFAVVGRQNNGIIAVADGVNWGEKARLAARCAVYGSVDYLNRALFEGRPRKFTTTDIFTALLRSFDAAHRLILAEEAALTTLACAIVAPLDRSDKFVACVCNVGDSLAYVYSQTSGVREITKGSHCIDLVRDMRDALGALGPVDGQNPELNNLTCSMTVVEKGDIVFLTSDGVSDNFDPVVGKFAAAERVEKEVKANGFPSLNLKDKSSSKSGLQSVSALQRHDLTSVRIEDILKNGIDGSGEGCKTARKVCENLIDFVYRLTSGKRNILEDKDLYYDAENKLLEPSEHRARRKQICQRIGMMPGKLDHACVVAYTVGDLGGPAPKSPRERQRDSRQSSPLPPPFPVLESRNSSHTLYDNVRLEPRRRKDEINRANRSRKEAALRESQPKIVQVKESLVPQKSRMSITNPSGSSWRSCSSEQVRPVTSSSHEQVHPLLKDSKGLVETVV